MRVFDTLPPPGLPALGVDEITPNTSVWFVSWGAPLRPRVKLRLPFSAWSRAVDRGSLPAVRAWLVQAEDALTEAFAATGRDALASAGQMAVFGRSFQEVTR